MTNLRDLEAVEVSLVSRAANKRKFLLLKSDEGSNDDMPILPEEILKAVLDTPLDNETKVDEVLKAAKLSDKAMNAIKGALRILNAHREEMPKNLMSMMADMAGYQMPKAADEHGDNKYKYPQSMRKADGTIDLTGVPEDVRPAVEALWKEHADMIKKSEENEKLLKAERDERLRKEYVAKATDYKHLSVNPNEFAGVLKEIAEKAPEASTKIESVLKAAEEALAQAHLFGEIGNSNPSTSGNAWGKIESAGQTLLQKGEAKTKAEAITKAMEANPNLYTEYLNESR